MNTKEAAELLGVGEVKLREMLKQELVDFGIAIKMPSGQYSYTIFRSKLYEYLRIPYVFEIGDDKDVKKDN